MTHPRPIVCYGDSITQHIAMVMGDRTIDRAIPGHGLSQGRAGNLPPVDSVPAGHPVICSFGWNDSWMVDRSPNAYKERVVDRLVALAERAQGQPIRVLELEPLANTQFYQIDRATTLATNRLLDQAIAEARSEARARGIPFDVQLVTTTQPAVGHRVDGLHYSPTGTRTLFSRAVASMAWDGASSTITATTAPDAIAQARATFTRTEVRAIQQKLKEQGFDPGAVDGIIGRDTMRAWRQFEQGTVGPTQVDDGQMQRSEVRELLNMRPRSPQGRA